MTLTLPYPPSTNHNAYWGQVGHRRYLTKRALAFRAAVAQRVMEIPVPAFAGLVAMTVDLYPPDRRRRDIDNGMKALLDALQHAGAMADDSQVQTFTVTRREIVKGGKCVVQMNPLPQ